MNWDPKNPVPHVTASHFINDEKLREFLAQSASEGAAVALQHYEAGYRAGLERAKLHTRCSIICAPTHPEQRKLIRDYLERDLESFDRAIKQSFDRSGKPPLDDEAAS